MVVRSFGGPEVLEPIEVDDPTPAPGEVLVEHEAIGVNFVDTQHRSGRPYPVEVPLIVGIEAAGRISGLGAGVNGLSIGERVAYGGIMPSVYAERAVVPASQLVPVPDDISLQTAAAVLVQGWTAHMLTTCLDGPPNGPTPPGHTEPMTAVVFAAAGGTGSLLTQLLIARGLRVIGVTSSAEKCEHVASLGTDPIDRSRQDPVAEVHRLTDSGADVAFDSIGGPVFDQARLTLRSRGHLIAYGQSAGPVAPIDPALLSGISPRGGPGSLTLSWPTLNDHNASAQQRRQRAAEVFSLVARGTVSAQVDATLGLSEAPEAHRRLQAGTTIGKLVLDPDR
jgi:NADPH2:quinone reductase